MNADAAGKKQTKIKIKKRTCTSSHTVFHGVASIFGEVCLFEENIFIS